MRHVLLVTFPAQGHINPSLQFAKKLMTMGIHVTFATSISARRRMAAAATAANLANGLTLVAFSDGFDDGFNIGDDAAKFMTEIRSQGSKALKSTILAAAEHGRPVTCLIYTLLLPWAVEVARELHLPSALLWIQPATVLSIYYHYFNGFSEEIAANSDHPNWEIQIPGAPSLSKSDLPSFLLPSSAEAHGFALPTLREQLDALGAEAPEKPKVLVNTFDALEAAALGAVPAYELIRVGPLIPAAFVDGGDPSDKSFGGDLFAKSDDCGDWLDSQPQSSVVYVSFGSLLKLPKAQIDEIAEGLLRTSRPFLWVIREEKVEDLVDMDKIGLGIGKIVRWCSQLEVLTHPSLGCFVTHCGWNSTLESLTCGVPVVAFPHWTDQGTNAKLIEDVWGTGVRVRPNGDGIVERGEIWRCVEEVMDGKPKSIELRDSANKWKVLAREAAGKNGSSTQNLKAYFDQLGS